MCCLPSIINNNNDDIKKVSESLAKALNAKDRVYFSRTVQLFIGNPYIATWMPRIQLSTVYNTIAAFAKINAHK